MKKLKYLLLPLCLISILLLVKYVSIVQEKEAKLQESLVKMRMEAEEYEKLVDEMEMNRLVMETAFHGFEKKNGQFLIDSEKDIYKLAELVNNGLNIEKGLLAGEASYRFLNDITLSHEFKKEFSRIGTQEHSFNGIIDGDGHTLNGYFLADYEDESRYFIAYGEGMVVNLKVNNLFKQQYKSYSDDDGHMQLFYNLLEAPFTFDMSSIPGSLYVTIENQAECDGLVEFLNSNEQIRDLYVTVAASSIDTAQLSNCIYEGRNLHAQVDFQAKEQQTDVLIPAEGFLSRIDTMEISEDVKTLVKEEQLLSFRKQIVHGLSCYSYLFDGWSEGEDNSPPIVILAEGAWGNKENICQVVTVPSPEYVTHDSYSIEAADVNFDGMLDLMIETGYSANTGGNWSHYRSAVWEPETETFIYFPSMPEEITHFDQSGKRIIYGARWGAGEERISVYEVIDGEYMETRLLVYLTKWNEPSKLQYYEYGELVEEIIVHEDYEVIQLFPDLDFWLKG